MLDIRERMKRNWHLTPVRQSQLQPTAQLYVNLSPFSLWLMPWSFQWDCTSGKWMKVFFSIHGVQESIKILKNPYLSKIWPFLLLQNVFKRYAMFMLSQEYMACIVIHQTKPKCVVVQHAKWFQDWSTFKADTRHVKIERNFWTHCTNNSCNLEWRSIYAILYKRSPSLIEGSLVVERPTSSSRNSFLPFLPQLSQWDGALCMPNDPKRHCRRAAADNASSSLV